MFFLFPLNLSFRTLILVLSFLVLFFHYLELEINSLFKMCVSPSNYKLLLLYVTKELISESSIQTLEKPTIGIIIQIRVPYEH